MSTLTKRILILAALVLYIILLFVFFLPPFESNCCGDGVAVIDDDTQTQEQVNNYPLASRWDTMGIFTGPRFDELKAGIMADDDSEKILSIWGQCRSPHRILPCWKYEMDSSG